MIDISEQVDLVRNLELVKNVFALATLLGGEDEITDCKTVSILVVWRLRQKLLTCGSNAERALDALELIGGHHGGVGCEAGVELAGLEVAGDVLATVAVADTANALDAKVVAQLSNDLVNDGLCVLGQVVLDPVHDLEALGAVQWHGVALKQIWDDGEVTCGSKLVGEELNVGECVAQDVAEDEDGIVGLLVGGVGKVGRDWTC